MRLVAASPDHFQSVSSVWCTDAPAQTVTVTELYHPDQQYNSGSKVTITETVPPVTVTQSVTLGGSGNEVLPTSIMTAPSSSQTFHVDVGTFNGKVQFVPDQLNASIGDVVLYNFLAKSHSLTQSNFATPCTYNDGFDTGLNQSNPRNISGLFQIPFQVKTTSPQWFYCKQPGPPNHCGLGMVFGLNPAGKMDQFIKNAIAQNGNASTSVSPSSVTSTATTFITSSTTASSTNGITTVTVGLNHGKVLVFDPPFIAKACAGDRIHFDFRATNHTLTESTFGKPCTKIAGAMIDTDFNNVNLNDIPNLHPFDFTVDSDRPRFFYCKQKNGTPEGHCGKGMVFALNVDASTFTQYGHNANATLPKIKGRQLA